MPAARPASGPPRFASGNRCPPPIRAQGRGRLRSSPRWSRKTRPQQGRQRQCPHHRRHRGTCSRGRNMSEHGSPKKEKTDESRIFRWARSEEHTSELQSLMRISYAVFCLKKKNHSLSYMNISITIATCTCTSTQCTNSAYKYRSTTVH